MQNNLTITEPELMELFTHLEERLPGILSWEDVTLENMLRSAQMFNDMVDVNNTVNLPIVLKLRFDDQANTITKAMCDALIDICSVQLHIVISTRVVCFDGVDLNRLDQSNVTFLMKEVIKIYCVNMVFKLTPHVQCYPVLNALILSRSTLDSNVGELRVSNISFDACTSFENVEKVHTSAVLIKYTTADEIPTNWKNFPSTLSRLSICKIGSSVTTVGVIQTASCEIPAEKLNNLIKHIHSINDFTLRTEQDVFSGPINMVSLATKKIKSLTYKTTGDSNLTAALHLLYMSDLPSLNTNTEQFLTFQEILIEQGLSRYAH